MTDETRARFLAAIAAQLPVERIAEVHLFPAIRQGGMESGVAVVAVELPDAVEGDAPAPAPRRYTVFSARYRHTLKGPDRGKWETSVTEEADAPLLTVDAVVRGVQRRSGDVDEIVRLSGDEVRAVLPAPATT
ncbi:MAG: hypothetical protein ACJ79A_00490 [Gemmatimonadaceae bacterium]